MLGASSTSVASGDGVWSWFFLLRGAVVGCRDEDDSDVGFCLVKLPNGARYCWEDVRRGLCDTYSSCLEQHGCSSLDDPIAWCEHRSSCSEASTLAIAPAAKTSPASKRARSRNEPASTRAPSVARGPIAARRARAGRTEEWESSAFSGRQIGRASC